MFPIGDENRDGRTTPIVTYVLILLNVVVFVYELMLGDGVQQFILDWGSVPREVIRDGEWLTLLSSMFIHGGFAHVIGNMAFLHVFGDNVEDALGHGRYLLFYLVTGMAAHAAHILLNPESGIPTVGASGAISGILGAYIVMFHMNRVRVWWGFFVTSLPAWAMIGLWAAQQFFATYASIAYTEQTEGGGVAYAAHAGGFIAGVVLALVLRGGRRDAIARQGGYPA
ncbi:MAG TPA: rhomboid family intramembrane serine protease [Candidatus Kapabacteria bacterium]|nr:rhomboid family intramembrane serine protease [Candidatus Kapabacteria bacterium]